MSRQEDHQRDHERREKRKQAQKDLRENQNEAGLYVAECKSLASQIANGKSEYKTVEAEKAARQETTTEQLRVLQSQLPILLRRLSFIPDFRNPKSTKHQLTLVLVYGMLGFVYQMTSRREANRNMTRPMFMENLRFLFPDLEELPHHDTVERVLAGIDVDKIEQAHLELIRRLIRKKKFNRYLINGCYPIAIDGTQKMVRRDCISKEWQQRKAGSSDDGEQRYTYNVYILEASLVFSNGMVMPMLSEFLDYTQGDTDNDKQDCEQRALPRLLDRLKHEFPRLPIIVLMDGMFANGPAMQLCHKNKYNWDFMIVLKDDSLPSVWEEYKGISKIEPNSSSMTWGNRRQTFSWVNNIEYSYGPNQRQKLIVHVLVCQEAWEEVDPDTAEVVTKTSRHAWLSQKPLCKQNLHERANLAARHRWGIEEGFLVEKHHGYHYKHCFSYDWNAMRGYHYLMHLGILLNTLAVYSTALMKVVRKLGVRGFISFVWQTMTSPWMDADYVRERLQAPFQLRLD